MRPADESRVPASVQSSADDNREASLQLVRPPTLHIHSFIQISKNKMLDWIDDYFIRGGWVI